MIFSSFFFQVSSFFFQVSSFFLSMFQPGPSLRQVSQLVFQNLALENQLQDLMKVAVAYLEKQQYLEKSSSTQKSSSGVARKVSLPGHLLEWLWTIHELARLSLPCTFFIQQAPGYLSFLLELKSKVRFYFVGWHSGGLYSEYWTTSSGTSNLRRELTLSQMYGCVTARQSDIYIYIYIYIHTYTK